MLEIILMLGLGVFAGLISGLLGLGGGVIVVPGLMLLFGAFGSIPADQVMHIAAGTSLCVMILTTLVSAWSHYGRGNVLKQVFWGMLPWVLVGALFGTILAHWMSSRWLAIIFGVFLLYNCFRLFMPQRKTASAQADHEDRLTKPVIGGLGGAMGFVSGLLGVGGGTVTVPILMGLGVEIRKAGGTSVALTFPVSIIGTVAVMLLGWNSVYIQGCTGYVYWPAVLWVGLSSMIFAQVGARLTDVISPAILRKCLAVLMLIIAIKMLIGSV